MQQDLRVHMQVIIIPEKQGASISLDISNKVILGWKISQKTDHEIKHANALKGNQIRCESLIVM